MIEVNTDSFIFLQLIFTSKIFYIYIAVNYISDVVWLVFNCPQLFTEVMSQKHKEVKGNIRLAFFLYVSTFSCYIIHDLKKILLYEVKVYVQISSLQTIILSFFQLFDFINLSNSDHYFETLLIIKGWIDNKFPTTIW